MPSVDSEPVPITLVTGFLGSGKTTLLNYILTANHGKRIAVIENEFGDQVGIEKLIAKDGQGGVVDMDDLFVEVSNGCICCAVKDDLVTTIEALLQKRDKFDYILLETSGLADPGPLASIFWLDDELESGIYLDSIITLVDAKNLEKNLSGQGSEHNDGKPVMNEAYKQLSYADKVVLNKKDLVSEEELVRMRERVASVNPLAEVLVTEFSKVDLDKILDVKAFNPDVTREKVTALEQELKDCQVENCDHDHHAHSHDHHHPHSHDQNMMSLTVVVEEPLNVRKVNLWLGELLWERDEAVKPFPEYFRIKGILSVHDSANMHILQGVHESFEVDESSFPFPADETPQSRVVFIGRHLDGDALKAGLSKCV